MKRTSWYDPGDHLPWFLPVPPEDEPTPTPTQPDRVQLTIMDALASTLK